MRLVFNKDKVHQGSIENVVIELNPEAAQVVELQKLKGKSLGNTVYLLQIDPLVRKQDVFAADARIIFSKVPEAVPVVHKEGSTELLISWTGVEVVPVEAPQEFLFGTFDVPARKKILFWVFIVLAVAVSGVAGWKFHQRWKIKQEQKRKLQLLKSSLLDAASYDDVVKLWQNKNEFQAVFPQIAEAFRDLETILFRYQFKPRQSELEKEEVMKAYRSFRDKVAGGLNGI